MSIFNIFNKQKDEDDVGLESHQSQFSSGLQEQIKDIIAPAALKVSSKHIEIGSKFSRTLAVVSYPRFLSKNWFSPIVNLDREFDISIFIHPIDSSKALRSFRKKVAQVESQIYERQKKGLVRDPKLDSAHGDLEALRDRLQQATERLFEIGIYITVYGETKEILDKAEQDIRSHLEGRLILVKPVLFQQEQGFRSTSPLGSDVLSIHTKLNTEPLSSIFPFVSFDLSDENGMLFGINRHNSSLILFDRFSLPNYNSTTFATSGAGKSYAIKLEVIRSLMIGIDVIVIDPEREFEKIAIATGGRYFNISLTSEHSINPFDIPPVSSTESPKDVLRENIINLVGFFRVILGNLTPEEDALIDKAITETYALKDITPDVDFSNQESPTLSDFELILSGLEGGEDISKRISKYTTGTWSGFINRPTNVDLNKEFVVFSIRDMEDELKPAAMHIITRFVWSVIRKNLKKRLLVVDEAWIMMKEKNTASFLYGLVKRGRKYYLGVATITQDVGDFLDSKFGKAILTNCSLKLLLRQSSTSIDLVQSTFNLTDEEKYLLLEASVGEGLFIAGLKRVAIQVIASYTENEIITSDPSQILAMKKTN